MIRIILVLFLIALLEACSIKQESGNASVFPAVDNPDSLKVVPLKYKTNFAVESRKEFSFTYNDIERLKLVQIDSSALVDLLQGDELLLYNQVDYSHYYYSIQKSNVNYRSITIVVNRDFDYLLCYLVYANDGRLLSRFEVAGQGGDGRFNYNSFGTFRNDSTYNLIKVREEFSERDSTVSKTFEEREFVLRKTGQLLFR